MISVVTLGWQNEKFASGFLMSLEAAWQMAGQPAIELIVVENGDRGRAAVSRLRNSATQLPLTIITLPDNRGFSGGANRGVAATSGEIVVVANLDLELDERFLVELGSMSSRSWDLLVPAVLPLEPARPTPLNTGPARRRLVHRHAWVTPPPETARRVQAGTGSCMVLRRSTIDRRSAAAGGLFDPEYHSFYEDVDLFWWAERHHLVSLYDPALLVRHALAGSFGGQYRFGTRPAAIQQQVIANWRITVWKNARTPADWIGWIVGEWAYLAQATLEGGPAGTARYFRSWVDAFRRASIIRRRRGALRV